VFTKVVQQAPDRLPAGVAEAAACAELGGYEVTWFPQFAWKMLVGLVVVELTARRLPEAEGRIADGGQVECGGMVVDATGVTGSTLTVRWSEVRRVVDGFAVVRVLTARGWRDLFRAGDYPTPDVYLLVALARRLARS
jgi:hypothetical protein